MAALCRDDTDKEGLHSSGGVHVCREELGDCRRRRYRNYAFARDASPTVQPLDVSLRWIVVERWLRPRSARPLG